MAAGEQKGQRRLESRPAQSESTNALTSAIALSRKTPDGSPEGNRTIKPPETVSGTFPSCLRMVFETQSACTSTAKGSSQS